ncbi:MAG: DUF4173 domain-containing protein [Anaerolineales bacterium]
MARLIRPAFLLPVSLLLGLLFDFLFWGKPIGVSFPIFVLLLLAAGFWLAGRAGLKPARNSLWLLVPIAFFSLVPAFRTEPLTVFLSAIAALLLLMLFAASFLGGLWPRYGFADYIAKLLGLVPLGLGSLRDTAPVARSKKGKKPALQILGTILRGLLFALPLLWFLAVLLSSADPFFAEWLGDLFAGFDKAPEYITRGFIVLILGYCFAAIYMYAFARSKKQPLLGAEKPLVAPFLGWGEALTMLVSVNLLFLAFVVVQFRYFYGGLANIIEGPTGYTFAEYARRGFGELVVAAVTTLMFFIILSALTKRKTGSQQTWFSGLGIALFALVAVILVSAFERLLLLEQAYGFTRLRTYPHVFMIWLGVLLLAVVVLEALGRQRAFALAVAAAVVGFTASLALLNVDGFIAATNVARAADGSQLDFRYLGSLSADSVPSLIAGYTQANEAGNSELAQELAISLACHFSRADALPLAAWQGWNLSADTSRAQWESLSAEPGFPEFQVTGTSGVTLNGESFTCSYQAFD